jgi:hypothetical protein
VHNHIQKLTSNKSYGGIVTPRLRITFPRRKALALNTEALSELIDDKRFFVRGDITPPPMTVPITRLSPRPCRVLEINQVNAGLVISRLIETRRLFSDKPIQLLAHLILAVRDSIIPLPECEDTGRMFFPYVKRVTIDGSYGRHPFMEIWTIILTPCEGVWKIDDTACVTSFEWGDAYCVLD